MTAIKTSALSIFALPALCAGSVLLGLGHAAGLTKSTPVAPAQLTALVDPDPHLNPSFALLLRSEARNVNKSRARLRQAEMQSSRNRSSVILAETRRCRRGLSVAVADYNLIARECTPTVFQTTRLPAVQEP